MADRSVLITGGTGALGGAVTSTFVNEGWRVVLPVRSAQPVPGAVVVSDVDLTDPAAVHRAVDVAAGEPGAPLRAVINLVGGFAAGTKVHETPVAEFELQFQRNLRPTYLVTHAALPHLIAAGDGAIVCISTRAALVPFSGAAGYIASKAAVIAFAQAVAVEYRDSRVRCNVVVPSVIDTPDNRLSMPKSDHSRWVPPAQIAAVIRFLASDESAATSGAVIPVYGRS
jgi:NAD(P)-dependent dehydrogenase (short-subunit alcohol dehydrogenase family)